jgi:hypothetical protein
MRALTTVAAHALTRHGTERLRQRQGRGLGVPRYRDVPTSVDVDEAWCA